MKIEFHTDEQSVDEGRAIVAMLLAVHGDEVLRGAFRRPPVTVSTTIATSEETGREIDGTLIDPVGGAIGQDEPDAAAAFGGAPNAFIAAIDADAAKGERDTAGIPWDERIHASTKTKTGNGQWTRRRNTPDATYDAVMAELKGSAPAIPPAPAAVIVPPPPTAAPAPSPAPAEAAASSSAPGGNAPRTFIDVMKDVTRLQGAGKVTPDDVKHMLTVLGVTPPSIIGLQKDPGLIPSFEALLADHVAGA